ncbi:MAG: hypothetical protein GF383_05425, partial [Candidatus Lokiarchaeota archaeon]|nr:hypothetical protein [Candidatus Lokiarchaeota archaeon]MBD3339335.1 hypothetical protein [Candidatus Lokiarchaeota archaeon]
MTDESKYVNNQYWYKLKTVQSEEDVKKRRGGQLRLSDVEELEKVCPEERRFLVEMIKSDARIPICKVFAGHVKDLSVFDSRLGDYRFPYLEVFSCFNKNKSIPIDHQFILNQKMLRMLYLGGIHFKSHPELPDLSSFSDLKYLYFHFYGSNPVLAPFGNPPNLERIKVERESGLEKLGNLGSLPSLVELDLSENAFTSLESFANLDAPKLKKLNLNHNKIVDLCGFEPISQFKSLEILDLSHNLVETVDARASPPSLEKLSLDHNN